MVNDATVIDADILALNGTRIDRVLMIPEDGQPTSAPVGSNEETDPTIFKLVSETPDLTTQRPWKLLAWTRSSTTQRKP
jgi:hypothetical protein